MPNPLFNAFNRGQQPNTPFGNISNLMAQFSQFKSNFSGDPKQKVQELLNSGQMSQQQFEQLSKLAEQFQSVFK